MQFKQPRLLQRLRPEEGLNRHCATGLGAEGLVDTRDIWDGIIIPTRFPLVTPNLQNRMFLED